MRITQPEYHRPVLLNECIQGLNIKPDGTYIDATFGGGGHSKEIIKHLKKGRLVAFDQDSEAAGNLLKDKHFLFVEHNFRFLKHFLHYYNIASIHGIIADLGISSHHINEPERGFSFRYHASLDMRMNQHSKLTAQKVVNSYSEEALKQVFKNYGEVKNAHIIARKIVDTRTKNPINTTTDLTSCIQEIIPAKKENQYLAQIYQALRIEVNQELYNLKELLLQATEYLSPGGRLVVISYHSLEDRLVKNYIRWGNFNQPPQKDEYGRSYTPLKAVNKKIITPGENEINENNRARSARLRIAEKVAV